MTNACLLSAVPRYHLAESKGNGREEHIGKRRQLYDLARNDTQLFQLSQLMHGLQYGELSGPRLASSKESLSTQYRGESLCQSIMVVHGRSLADAFLLLVSWLSYTVGKVCYHSTSRW